MMRRKKSAPAEQLSFDEMDVAADEGWWRCQGIFTPNYLRRHLLVSEHAPSLEECRPVHEALRARWSGKLAGLRKQAEAYTRTAFLDPALADLGWFFLPEQRIPEGRTRKKPDYCLFVDEESQQRVAPLDAIDIFRGSATVLEAKKVKHPLDVRVELIHGFRAEGWFWVFGEHRAGEAPQHKANGGGNFHRETSFLETPRGE